MKRPQIGVFWVAILVMAALVPFLPVAISVDVPVRAYQRLADVRHAQPLSLLSVHLFRGPPSLGSFV
jgi:hypothetical protein